jgi:serine/threonine protein kinase
MSNGAPWRVPTNPPTRSPGLMPASDVGGAPLPSCPREAASHPARLSCAMGYGATGFPVSAIPRLTASFSAVSFITPSSGPPSLRFAHRCLDLPYPVSAHPRTSFLTPLPGLCFAPRHSHPPAPPTLNSLQASGDALDLLGRMLQLDPLRRISTADALRHPYFSNNPQPTPPALLPRPMKREDAPLVGPGGQAGGGAKGGGFPVAAETAAGATGRRGTRGPAGGGGEVGGAAAGACNRAARMRVVPAARVGMQSAARMLLRQHE